MADIPLLPKDLEISSYRAYQEGNKIILEPLVEISAETIFHLHLGLKFLNLMRKIKQLELTACFGVMAPKENSYILLLLRLIHNVYIQPITRIKHTL
ncbi:hypothetical protein PNK_p0030 (plasmid) [Candidatus Protochlamydia naegleriophila]|uniref:Uncharacterized protein n=1 Tax=Candidatus Protochlamydia naegleriophila TaxID=389348 RepID=A0A0U5JGZ8_9BACT|nr:hypothetical protein PNK_p0030 [Candidatus Protochlamydia naegleriophila]